MSSHQTPHVLTKNNLDFSFKLHIIKVLPREETYFISDINYGGPHSRVFEHLTLNIFWVTKDITNLCFKNLTIKFP